MTVVSFCILLRPVEDSTVSRLRSWEWRRLNGFSYVKKKKKENLLVSLSPGICYPIHLEGLEEGLCFENISH